MQRQPYTQVTKSGEWVVRRMVYAVEERCFEAVFHAKEPVEELVIDPKSGAILNVKVNHDP